MPVDVRLLGIVEVCADGIVPLLGGPKQRAVLADLALHASAESDHAHPFTTYKQANALAWPCISTQSQQDATPHTITRRVSRSSSCQISCQVWRVLKCVAA